MKEYIDSSPPTTHAAIAPYKEDMEQARGGASNENRLMHLAF